MRQILFFLLVPLTAISQTPELENLERQLQKTDKTAARVELLNTLSNRYLAYKPERAKEYAEQALALSRELNDIPGEILALNRLGEYEFRQSNYARAVEFSTQSLKLAEQQRDSSAMANAYRVLGNTNTFGFKQFDKALGYQLKALAIYERKGDLRSMASLYGNITWIYGQTDQHLPEAHEMARRGAKLADSLRHDQLLSYNYNSLGLIFRQEKKYDSALYYLDRSNALAQQASDRAVISYNKCLMGDIYLRIGEVNKARMIFLEAELESHQLNLREVRKDAYRGLAESYHRLGDYPRAYSYETRYARLKDSLVNWEITQKALMMEFELDEQRRQIKMAELEAATKQAVREKNVYLLLIGIVAVSSLVIITLIIRNNRQRRKTNELLQQKNAELAQANGIKDKLFSIIGHDLRSPLVSLKGLLGMAVRNEVSENEFKQFAPQLNQHVIGVNETLENLLQWSNSQMNGWQHHPEKLPLKKTVTLVFQLFHETAHTKNIELQTEGADVNAVADRNQAELILRNLVHNAIKFTPDGGRVSVSTAREGRFAVVRVSDTGVGIPKDQIHSLFVRHDIRTTRGTRGERGTGLGLSLCYEMTARNNGELSVASEEGRGSTFILRLPLDD